MATAPHATDCTVTAYQWGQSEISKLGELGHARTSDEAEELARQHGYRPYLIATPMVDWLPREIKVYVDPAEYHTDRARRMLEIVGRHRPGRRRRQLLVEATRQRRLASEALEVNHG